MYYYEFGKTMLVDICNLIKSRSDACIQREIGDRAAAYKYSDILKRSLDDLARGSKIKLNHDQIAAMQLLNTCQSLSMFGWMDHFFHSVGDRPPNCNDEIHLEPITQNEIWYDYKMDMESIGDTAGDCSQFRKMWKACFRK